MTDKDESTDAAYLSLNEISAMLPGRPGTGAIWRWCRRGVKSRGGERIKLQHARAGRKIVVQRGWLDRFLTDLAAADMPTLERAASPAKNPEHTRAVDDLRRRGVAASA